MINIGKILESWDTLNWSKGSVGQKESRSQILSPRSSIPNTGFRIPDHRSQTPNPKSQILNRKSKFTYSKSKIHEKFGRNFFCLKKNLGQKKFLQRKIWVKMWEKKLERKKICFLYRPQNVWRWKILQWPIFPVGWSPPNWGNHILIDLWNSCW